MGEENFYGKCFQCTTLYDFRVEFQGIEESRIKDYYETSSDNFMCRSCFGTDEKAFRTHLGALKAALEIDCTHSKEEEKLCVTELMGKCYLMCIEAYGVMDLPEEGNTFLETGGVLVDDENALNVLKAYGDERWQTHVTKSVTGDGNCMFNTVCLALWGHERHSALLRLITAVEVIENKAYYSPTNRNTEENVSVDGWHFAVDNYNRFLREIITDGCYMGAGHLAALANSLRMPIRMSHAVGTNTSRQMGSVAHLNRQITLDTAIHRGRSCLEMFCSKWSVHFTTTQEISSDATFETVQSIVANHFVILIQKETPTAVIQTLPMRLNQIPGGKVIEVRECLDILKKSKPEDFALVTQKYDMSLIGHYYLRGPVGNQRNCKKLTDGFEEWYKGIKPVLNSDKRAYVQINGMYKLLQNKMINGKYKYMNGCDLEKEHVNNVEFVICQKKSFNNIYRRSVWISNANWAVDGRVLVQYYCKIMQTTSVDGVLSLVSGEYGVAGDASVLGTDKDGRSALNVLGSKKKIEVVTDKFLDALEAYDLIISGTMMAKDELPFGIEKANRRFITDKSYCKASGREDNVFIDDLFGVVKGGTGYSVKKTFSMPSRTILKEVKNATVVEVPKKVQGKLLYDNEPQVTVHRRHSSIDEGKRCITWVTNSTGWQSHYLWEYLGCENAVPLDKVRTHPQVLDHAARECLSKPPSVVYTENIAGGINSLRNLKQVSNIKHKLNAKEALKQGAESSTSYADQVQAMITAQSKGSLPILVSIFLENLPAMFILSAPYVYDDIGRFCMEHTALKKQAPRTKMDTCVRQLTVLGIDKTFSLTAGHVTTTVYKNLALKHKQGKSRGKSPHFFGPVLIHNSSTESIFKTFFTNVDLKLTEAGYQEGIGPVVVVCDGELALRNALKSVWPMCKILSCHQHLVEDLGRWLNAHIGIHLTKERANNLHAKVFHTTHCLAKARNVVVFDTISTEILQSVGNWDPNDVSGVQTYLAEVLFPKMRTNVDIAYSLPEMNLFNLTNNPVESMNNILKLRQNYQTASLTKFAVNMKNKEYDFRPQETRRAVCGEGNYGLSEYFEKIVRAYGKVNEWYSYVNNKVVDQIKEEAIMKKVMKAHLPLNHSLEEQGLARKSTSLNGRMTVNVPGKRAGKKPGKQCTSKAAKRARVSNSNNL